MKEREIEEKMASSVGYMGRFHGGRFATEEFCVSGDAVVPLVEIEVWNEQKRLFPVEKKPVRKPARVKIAGVPCEVWYTVPDAVYGFMTCNGRRTGEVLKQYIERNSTRGTAIQTMMM